MTPEEIEDRQARQDEAAAFLAKCHAEFERERKKHMATLVGVTEKHLRKFGNVMAVSLALAAKRKMMRFPPERIGEHVREEYDGLVRQINTHNKLLAKVTEEATAAEAERERGREIARRNAQVGVDRSLQLIDAEIARHEKALATLTTPAAIDAEHERHAARAAELTLKAEGALAALAAVT